MNSDKYCYYCYLEEEGYDEGYDEGYNHIEDSKDSDRTDNNKHNEDCKDSADSYHMCDVVSVMNYLLDTVCLPEDPMIRIMKPFGVVIGVEDNDGDGNPEEVVPEPVEINTIDPADPLSEDFLDLTPLNTGNGNTHIDNQIEVEGVPVYKATILKNAFAPIPLSNDRLRRVRGLTPFTLNPDCYEGLENTLLIGDPVIAHHDRIVDICQVRKITKANRVLKQIKIDDMAAANVKLTVFKLKLKTSADNKLLYSETDVQTVEDKITVIGYNIYPIQPELKCISDSSNTDSSVADFKLCFDKQFLIDLGVTLRVHHRVEKVDRQYSDTGSSTGEKCYICPKKVVLKKMRMHVGKHIALKDIEGPQICGFCGRSACSNSLKQTSRGAKAHYKIVSNCSYEMKIGKEPKFSKHAPCTNRMVKCPACKADIWVYNATYHYQDVHPSIECPEFVSQAEWGTIKLYKF